VQARFHIPVAVHITIGVPHIEIATRADATGADLVIVGAHGERPLRDMFVGATAQRLGRMLRAPLVIARNRSPLPYERALIAVDFNAAAADAARVTATLFPDAALHFLHVRNVPIDVHSSLASISAEARTLSGFPAELRGLRFVKPIHVIAGQQSDYVTDRHGAEFQPMFPEAQVEVIEQAGHWVHADQRDRFLDAVTRALRTRPSSPLRGAAAAA